MGNVINSNEEAIKDLTIKFPTSYVAAWLIEFLGCFRWKYADRVKMICDMFNIDKEKLLDYFVKLNPLNIYNEIDEFVGGAKDNVKLGISTIVEKRLGKHNNKLCVLRNKFLLENMQIEMLHFAELLWHSISANAKNAEFKVLNVSSGFDTVESSYAIYTVESYYS